MNCCSNCFVDAEIKGIVVSISVSIGSCDYCGAKEQQTAPISELQDIFAPLLELYKPDKDAPNDLFTQINSDWSVFSNENHCAKILRDICGEKYSFLLSSNVKLKYTINDSVADWDNFANEIKNQNRFFIEKNIIVRDVVKNLLNRHTKKVKAGKMFFRGRIAVNADRFPPEELCQPPHHKATPGRANPDGISYLYLAEEKETTLYEIGASLNDYVCIGQFELLDDIEVVVLKEVHSISPFLEDVNLEDYVKNKDILTQFGIALSTPLRSFDSLREYFPTQYLCEYVKSLGIDGVEYASAMNKGGTNYAIFDGGKCRYVDQSTITVEEINIKTE